MLAESHKLSSFIAMYLTPKFLQCLIAALLFSFPSINTLTAKAHKIGSSDVYEQRVQDLKVKKTAQKDVPIERRVTTVELKQPPPNASEEDDCVVGHQIPVAAGFMDTNEAHQSPAIVLARWTTRSNTGNGALHGCKVLEAFGIYWDHQW